MATPSTNLLPFEHNYVDALLTGHYWILDTTRIINWSISDGFWGESWLNPEVMISHIDQMLSIIETFIDVNFQYVGYFDEPDSAYYGGSDINYSWDSGLFMDSSSIWAIGNFPTTSNQKSYMGQPGDVFLNLNSAANTLDYEPGGAGFALLLHETGHALGLKHPHDDGGTGSPIFKDYGIDAWDVEWASIMSYKETYGWDLLSYNPVTPMIMDVIGLQFLYGANTNANSGDNTWAIYDIGTYDSLYDTAGFDTLNFYGGNGWYVNLEDEYAESNTGDTLIWLLGDFEVIGGSAYSDTLIGDDLDNVFMGWEGNNVIDGGNGIDTALYEYYPSDYEITVLDGVVRVVGMESNDTLYNIESLYFADKQTYSINDFAQPEPFIIDKDDYNWDNDLNTGNNTYIPAEKAQLYRAYMGAMGRLPDAGGFIWWGDQIELGKHDLFSMASGFIDSVEFKGYADKNFDNYITNHEFITHMYEGVFDRAPDQGGYEYWMEQLDSGSAGQGEVLIYMTQSNEYIDKTLDVVTDYLFV